MAKAQIIALFIFAWLVGVAAAGGRMSIVVFGSLFGIVAVGLALAFKNPIFIILPLLFVGGAIYYHAFFAVRQHGNLLPDDRDAIFQGVIVEEPRHFAKGGSTFEMKLDLPYRGLLQVFASEQNFSYGDRIALRGVIIPGVSERHLPKVVFPAFIEIKERHQASRFRELLFDIKTHVTTPFRKLLPQDHAAFLSGITLGIKNDFSEKLASDLKRSGTTHLVALSGFNIHVLVVAVSGVLIWLISRRSAFWYTLAFILLFVLAVGGEPSIVRAAIMAGLVLLGKYLGRTSSLSHAIIWAAFFMVLWNPATLFEAGFLLSFASLLGIVYVSPAIEQIFLKKSRRKYASILIPAISLTFAAELAVIPIALMFFDEFSILSFAANILVLPFIPFTMLFGFLAAGIALAFPPIAFPVVWAAEALLTYELGVIELFSRMAIMFQVENFSWLHATLYYSALLSFVLWNKNNVGTIFSVKL